MPKMFVNSNLVPQISNSEKNLRRPYDECSGCGQFVKWEAPRARTMEMKGSSHGHHESTRMEAEGIEQMMLKIWQELKELRLEIKLVQSRNSNCVWLLIIVNFVLCILIIVLLLK